MTKEFNELSEKILKVINEQNKKLELLDDKIGKIIIEKVKEYLSNEDITISEDEPIKEANNLLISGFENAIKELLNKVNQVEEENEVLKEKLVELDKKVNNIEKNKEIYEELAERLNLLERSNKITTDTESNNSEGISNGELAIKKDGKVVNIVINV